MADDVFKIRKRPKKDPLTWIRQGEYGEGDPVGETNIRGVTNRPLKELLENDLDLLRYLEKALNLVSGVESSKLNQAQHFDEIGSGLEHLDMTVSPSRQFYSPSEITHQDHNDTNQSLHQDHTDHSDRAGASETTHVDRSHQDQTVNVPHSDYQDHANTHGDKFSRWLRPHSDAPHTDHSDHQDYTSTVSHGDHNDHVNVHGDYCNNSTTFYRCHVDHSDHVDYNNHTDCSTETLPSGLGVSCVPGGKHYDRYVHSDYPANYTYHYDGYSSSIQCSGYCHDDHGDGFTHLDGQREWFHSDLYNHGDYPPNHTDHLDSFVPDHSDHGDTSSAPHVDHHDHGDYHLDHSDSLNHNDHYDNLTPNHSDHGDTSYTPHVDHYDHGDYHLDHSDLLFTSEGVYVNYTDHLDSPHSDVEHIDDDIHSDSHSDQPTIHFDQPAHSDHLDSPEIRHSDHRDIPHEDGGIPHLDYTPSNTPYHLDYTPISSAYHYDNGEEHYDLSLVPEAHLDRGLSSPRDLSEGIYEEVYKWVLHGDRSFHHDYDGHGDVEPGGQEHTDHSDIEFHEDYPHGDTPYQDYYGLGHLDRPPEQILVHNDHLDGTPPQQLHGDSVSLQITSPHQDHVDTIHSDYHLDNPHLDNSGHTDITNTVTNHTDYSHQDHFDHSDWDHEDHTDVDLVFGKWKYIVSYADHGDYTLHQDLPHSDRDIHLDYIPEHDDHGDHADLAHGDTPGETIHEDTTIPASHYDITVPHDDYTAYHNDFSTGGHADFHADHTDHGDYTIEERHGDFTSTQPHIDYPHYDHTDIQSHSDGPRGPQHEDLYYHLDVPHADGVEHTDRTTTG